MISLASNNRLHLRPRRTIRAVRRARQQAPHDRTVSYCVWCEMVRNGAVKNLAPKSRLPIQGESVARLSISLSAEDKAGLERIAAKKRVSIAWVIRDAVAGYLAKNTQKST